MPPGETPRKRFEQVVGGCPLRGPQENIRISLGVNWVLPGGPWQQKPTEFLKFSVGSPWGASRKPEDFLWFSLGAPEGDPRKTEGIAKVVAGCSLWGPHEYLWISSGFRWVPPRGTSGKPKRNP